MALSRSAAIPNDPENVLVKICSNAGSGSGDVADLVGEMSRRWRRGERPWVEEYLAAYPELKNKPEVAFELINHEICLRQEHGEEMASVEVLQRFPQWKAQLELLFKCHRVLNLDFAGPCFPAVGESLGGFQLLAELGRGLEGRVFLATQSELADRPVVLKATPLSGGEHLSLARLQHTHIVPLYFALNEPARRLRLLCMPYFGGMSLGGLLEKIGVLPVAERTGRDVLQALDRGQAASAVHLSVAGSRVRQMLERSSYGQVVCWIGACLADALQYAHERGMVHLDLKPANVLLTAEGQPMLLDFHLARTPLLPDGPVPEWFGGTPAYMSPEQQLTMKSLRESKRIAVPVTGQSDLFSLGAMLVEMLGGHAPGASLAPILLPASNPAVSPGLADILAKCLAADPRRRYANAAALAQDLRCHLADLPLQGVANRSLTERWQKWRRRRPQMLSLFAMTTIALVLVGASGLLIAAHFRQERRQAREALAEAQRALAGRDFDHARLALQRGLALAEAAPWNSSLTQQIVSELGHAKQAQLADELHALVDGVRAQYGLDVAASSQARAFEAQCSQIWQKREVIIERLAGESGARAAHNVRDDLLDLALFRADLRVRLATADATPAAQREALEILEQAETLFGPSCVLYRERESYARALGMRDVAEDAACRAVERPPRTLWEHYALGHCLLRSGNLPQALQHLDRVLDQESNFEAANYFRGLCHYRLLHYDDAILDFTACIALRPGSAGLFFYRALTYSLLGQNERAARDYTRALKLDPGLAAAALNRGVLYFREKRFGDADNDLQRALILGANPGAVYYNRALIDLARNERSVARDHLRKALMYDADHVEAAQLQKSLAREE